MKSKLALVIACALPFSAMSKDLPDVEFMMNQLNASGFTKASDWQAIGDESGFKQDYDGGFIVVTPQYVSNMIVVEGQNQDELMNSFMAANLMCASSALTAIDMLQNKTLVGSMSENFAGALKAHEHKTTTLVWGYKYETVLVGAKDGLIASCTLKP
ncbi:hypothetical protein [Vibrio metoecus]|uniref:hypothetical protein n=1 Tax=Vibrio metoecus TaxID=1481663 RepID=UPI000BA97CF7|nr:hypothetical protein [Vibrio metoecus]PAR29532.1 hypothetical protein CGU00_03190 [Vibrio metoecus]PAR61492.1 hypothetical protein CGT90_10800 [Vibrio metoecus]